MKVFLMTATLAATVLTFSALSVAGEPVELEYSYAGDTGVNLGAMIGGPLSVSSFADGRTDSTASDIQRPGKDPLTLQEETAAELLQRTFTEAFAASGAQLGEADTPLVLQGNVIELQIQDTPQGLETLIRVELTLRNQGRSAWQSVVFSRAQSETKDAAVALKSGLDRLVAELFRDDYFLMELGIF